MSRLKGDDDASIRALFTSRCDEFLREQRLRRREMRRVARLLADGGGEDGSTARPADPFSTAANAATAPAAAAAAASQPAAVAASAAAAAQAVAAAQAAAARKDARKEHIVSQRRKRAFYASQFMQPEWLTCRPSFRAPEWLIVARPDGQRCIVSAARGLTTSRTKNGNVLHRWPSELPMGSRKTNGGRKDEYSLLDCVFHKPTRTYYVVDIMCWKGRLLYDTEASFRMWWLRTKLAEECPSAGRARPANKFALLPAAVFPCTPEGLAAARSGPAVPYPRDGVLFYHKQGFYEQGTTPLVRQWKDEACSRYVVNTSAGSSSKGVAAAGASQQRVVLHVTPAGALVTAEGQKLGQLTRAHVQQLKVQPGDFLRFRVGGVRFDAATGSLQALDAPQFEAVCGPSRMQADTGSMIVFQHLARSAAPLDVRTVAAGIVAGAASPRPAAIPGGGVFGVGPPVAAGGGFPAAGGFGGGVGGDGGGGGGGGSGDCWPGGTPFP